MQVMIKGHHFKVPEQFRARVTEKLAKVERLGNRIIAVDVEVSEERNPRQSSVCHRVEITVRSRGPVVRAEACAQDAYSAFDAACAKLEARLRKLKDKRKIHRGSRAPVSVAAATAPLAEAVVGATPDGTAASPAPTDTAGEPSPATVVQVDAQNGETVVPVEMDGDGPLVVREKSHRAGPMSIDQALLAMELVGHDFYLFRDTATGLPSVVYRRRGYDYGVIRLQEEGAEGH